MPHKICIPQQNSYRDEDLLGCLEKLQKLSRSDVGTKMWELKPAKERCIHCHFEEDTAVNASLKNCPKYSV